MNGKVLVLIAVFILCGFPFADGACAVADLASVSVQPSFRADFDNAVDDARPSGSVLKNSGAALISDGVSGKALQLNSGSCMELDSKTIFPASSTEGSLALWVRPHWDYYAVKDGELLSHTYLSMTWDDGKSGYFALSDGWWEPAGSRATYFIFNNQQYAFATGVKVYNANEWVYIACTWKTGASGYVRLYVDGSLTAELKDAAIESFSPKASIALGSDFGCPIRKNRWADCDVDELMFFTRALTADEIAALRNEIDPSWKTRKFAAFYEALENPGTPLKSAAGEVYESRAILDEGTAWVTPEGARTVIARIKKAGFNAYVPCVWHGGGTRYPCDLATAEPGVDFTGGDPLERIIGLAHDNGIEVHPWFCVGYRYRDSYLEQFYQTGTPANFFDLHNAAFRDFMVALILDVVKRYAIDGVNLDYIRTGGVCTSTSCQEDYSNAYGRSLLQDIKTTRADGALEDHVQAWQDAAVESVVKRVNEGGKSLRKSLVVSVDGHPIPTSVPIRPNAEGRQEIKWAKAGLVDVIFDMDYTDHPDFLTHRIVVDELAGVNAKAIPLLGDYDRNSDNKAFSRDPRLAAALISYVQKQWRGGGVGLYLYNMLSDAQIEALGDKPFGQPAKPFWGRIIPITLRIKD